MTELPPAEVQRRWQHQIVANNRLAAENALLRSHRIKLMTGLKWTQQFSDDYWQSITHFATRDEIENLRGNFKEIDDTVRSVEAEEPAASPLDTIRALLTAARAYVSREASGVGGAEARALIGEIDRVLGRDG